MAVVTEDRGSYEFNFAATGGEDVKLRTMLVEFSLSSRLILRYLSLKGDVGRFDIRNSLEKVTEGIQSFAVTKKHRVVSIIDTGSSQILGQGLFLGSCGSIRCAIALNYRTCSLGRYRYDDCCLQIRHELTTITRSDGAFLGCGL